ncbi:uncharacterized protein LOC129942922 isoform X1 [Eupeodes corollae]|uniref:uncharacterized protein LOC129942922 isoform X1 n=1 Tax=Eupeodes corollae TaxID=290404 RepID=UPI0024907F8D|nr:uncharacterized protein LOC129942922 isoform X1 [Eupeodes corollae]XP_055908042.1 uncharacterized protein LOC129942922 isoform X1 [Eupeodes corollae]XP_055908043.1 uncharacterized protein LOC129942922 isoform X1 [Eupeodes corollae]XP_055908044.1 uncharacterized protein LOC129942922 isoform X1 [Eupeodes corollae]
MEAEEITKLVDGVYKNILEKFNPGARQLITAGKAYLKALHGAASASRMFNEALAKIAMNAQQSGTGDIGSALMNVVTVYKEIQDQQMNILKAFYVDLLVPLETNLEKDTKVVQHEQKKFMQQHKVRTESYQKAISTMKKQRKKKNSPENTEKEIKSLQLLDDQKKKLDNFCEQSYKSAMTQERRRYGFVLERQCSISKHWMAFYAHGKSVIENNLDNWQEVASSREVIPTVYDSNFLRRMEKLKEDESHSGSSMLKKARSVDAPYGDMRTLNDHNYSQNSLPRAKSDFNLTASASNISNENWDQRPVVKALYAYMPSGENQLPFAEGDRVALVGTKAKGWQFGENLRTQMFGWFPIAYTNAEQNEKKPDRDRERDSSYENVQFDRNGMRGYQEYLSNQADAAAESDSTYRKRNNSADESSPTRMFGDTIMYRNQKKYRGVTGGNPKPGPPPTLPAPVPSGSNSSRMLNSSQSFCLPNGPPLIERRKHKNQNGPPPTQPMTHGHQKHLREGTAKTSLHSSNDSGFANEPPPQPEVDYSDEEHSNRVPIRRRNDASYKSSREVNSWTLSRNFKSSTDNEQKVSTILRRPIKQSTSFENIIASDDEILNGGGGIKRTKSFWRFGKSDEVLAGMSLWRHRDLVQLPEPEADDKTMERLQPKSEKSPRSSVLLGKNSSRQSISSNETKQRKESSSTVENFEEENIYGVTPMHEDTIQRKYNAHQSFQEKHMPKSRMKIMKTIEIDIENPSDAERMNSLKHGQNNDYRENAQQSVSSRTHQKQKVQSGTNLSNGKSSKKANNKQASNGKQLMQQKMISKPREQPSSEDSEDNDDDDDDDNGTLKMSDVNNFFDDIAAQETGMVMKTVKRQDILKQYYTSEDEESDVDIKSTSSDPYDCIVINDHLVRKDDKNRRHVNSYQKQMEFQTFRSIPKKSSGNNSSKPSTLNNSSAKNDEHHKRNSESYMVDSKSMGQTATILPRTRLVKSSNLTLEKNLKKTKENNANLNAENGKSFSKTYGPWYDFWDHQDQQSEDHSLHSSKVIKN